MIYFVRTDGERVLHESFAKIEYHKLLIRKDIEPAYDYINDLTALYVSLAGTNVKGAVLLDDDIILGDNFDKLVNDAINQNSDKIINFYYDIDFNVSNVSDLYLAQDSKCVYYPTNILPLLIQILFDMRKTYGSKLDNIGLLLNYTLKKLTPENSVPDYVMHKPSLVQCYNKPTKYFINYFDKLNIDYDTYAKNIKSKDYTYLVKTELKLERLLNIDKENWKKEAKIIC